jgi:uncharacterized protein
MTGLLVLATVAQLLSSPPVSYTSEMSAEARSTYESLKDAPPAELLTALEGLAAGGDLSAVEFLGEIYNFALFGVARDAPRACDLFERAAPHRPDAAHNFATCLYNGEGRPQDLPAARQWYARAAEGGWTTAHCALGNMLVRAEGGERDAENGIALCRLAAERGDRDAQTDLGIYLLVGNGVARDAIAARGWLEKAARQRQANAAYLLAQVYWNGDGVEKDVGVARQWWEVAHEEGRPDAAFRVMQTILANMRDSPGVRPTSNIAFLTDAIAWAEIAVEREPDPGRRSQAAEVLASFKQLRDDRSAD